MARRVTPPTRSSTRRPRWLVRLNQLLDLDHWLGGRLPVQALPKALWVALLLVVYIYFSHSAERLLRRTDRARRELNDYTTDYTTEKAALMKEGRQSMIARRVQGQGLVDYKNQEPPTQIVLADSTQLYR